MNKAELIEVLTTELETDRGQASRAVEAMVDAIVRAVQRGESVTITGFGVFERRQRAARVARNPRTGETVKVKPTSVPAFRPGAQFKAIVSGSQKLPADGPAVRRGAGAAARKAAAQSAGSTAPATRPAATTAPAAAPVKKAVVAKAPVRKAVVAKAPVRKAVVAKAPVKKAVVAKAPVKKAVVAKAPVKKAVVAKAPAKEAVAAKAPVRKVVAKKPPVKRGRR